MTRKWAKFWGRRKVPDDTKVGGRRELNFYFSLGSSWVWVLAFGIEPWLGLGLRACLWLGLSFWASGPVLLGLFHLWLRKGGGGMGRGRGTWKSGTNFKVSRALMLDLYSVATPFFCTEFVSKTRCANSCMFPTIFSLSWPRRRLFVVYRIYKMPTYQLIRTFTWKW